MSVLIQLLTYFSSNGSAEMLNIILLEMIPCGSRIGLATVADLTGALNRAGILLVRL